MAAPARKVALWELIGLAVAGLALALAVVAAQWKSLAILGLPVALAMLRYPDVALYVTAASTVTGYAAYAGGTGNIVNLSIPKLLGVVTLGSLFINRMWFREGFYLGSRVLIPLAFLAASGISFVLAPYLDDSGQRTMVQLAGSFSFYFLVLNILDDDERVTRLLWALTLAYTLLGLYSLYQYYFVDSSWTEEFVLTDDGSYSDAQSAGQSFVDRGIKRSSGFSHPGVISFIITMLLPFTTYLFYTVRRIELRALLLGCIGIMSFTLVMTHTRAGFIAGGLLFLYMIWRRVVPINAPLVALGLVGGVAAVAIFVPSTFVSRVLDVGTYAGEGSVRIRVENQLAAMRFFAESPAFGIGVGRFEELNPSDRKVNREVTNMIMEIATETGLLGLVTLLVFLGMLLRDARYVERKRGPPGATNIGTMAVAAVGVALFQSLFMSNQDFREWWLFMAIVPALRNIELRKAEAAQTATADSDPAPASA